MGAPTADTTDSSNVSLHRAVQSVLADTGQPAAWSVIMTVFGDAIVPRGGSLWTGSLIEIMALLGFNSGVVRTALSRLVADGWVESTREGRRSFYRLTAHGSEATQAAARRIYRAGSPNWDGTWDLAIVPDPAARADLRRLLTKAGFGALSAEVFLRPSVAGAPSVDAAGAFVIRGPGNDGQAQLQIAARAWDIEAIAQSYRSLQHRLGPLRAAKSAGKANQADALAARLLLIHEFRRVVLRDPDLPAVLLPSAWPGLSARKAVASAYRDLLDPSEAWLSRHVEAHSGPLPPPTATLLQRFAPAPTS